MQRYKLIFKDLGILLAAPKTWIQISLLVGVISFQNCGKFQSSVTQSSSLGYIENQTVDLSLLDASCSFNGVKIADGQTKRAYLNSIASATSNCVYEDRKCSHGVLSGTFAYNYCLESGPQSCLFNGVEYQSGSTIQAYPVSVVGNGESCAAETRTCTDGAWSGSAQYASCQTSGAQSCLFGGMTIPSGKAVAAYLNSTADASPSGSCVVQARLCLNGVLSGSYNFASCTPSKASSCLFNGVTMSSGSTTTAFKNSTEPFGGTCQIQKRTCTDGVLSGDFTYASCTVAAGKSCLFNGQQLPSGGSVRAYSTSTVPYGQVCVSEARKCTDGNLSGSDTFASCQPAAPQACVFQGMTLASGQTVKAFSTQTVPYGQTCTAENRTCTNGTLSGSNPYADCNPLPGAACTVGSTSVSSGQSVNLYASASVPYGGTCVSQSRLCTNGQLSGSSSYSFSTCSPLPPAGCILDGQALASGQTQAAYTSSSVPFGSSCSSVQVTATCNNGAISTVPALSGSQTLSHSCQPLPPPPCNFLGQQIPNGGSTSNAFTSATVPYGASCSSVQSTLSCTNGILTASNNKPISQFVSTTCNPLPGASCTFNGQTIPDQHSYRIFNTPTDISGGDCSNHVYEDTCNNGTFVNPVQDLPVQYYPWTSCTPDRHRTCPIASWTVNSGDTVWSWSELHNLDSRKIGLCIDGTTYSNKMNKPEAIAGDYSFFPMVYGSIYAHAQDPGYWLPKPSDVIDASGNYPVVTDEGAGGIVWGMFYLNGQVKDFDVNQIINRYDSQTRFSHVITIQVPEGASVTASSPNSAAISFGDPGWVENRSYISAFYHNSGVGTGVGNLWMGYQADQINIFNNGVISSAGNGNVILQRGYLSPPVEPGATHFTGLYTNGSGPINGRITAQNVPLMVLPRVGMNLEGFEVKRVGLAGTDESAPLPIGNTHDKECWVTFSQAQSQTFEIELRGNNPLGPTKLYQELWLDGFQPYADNHPISVMMGRYSLLSGQSDPLTLDSSWDLTMGMRYTGGPSIDVTNVRTPSGLMPNRPYMVGNYVARLGNVVMYFPICADPY